VRISRVVSLAGVCVMEEPARGEPTGAIGTFLGGGPDEVPERYAQAEPLSRVPLGIPTLLVHGEADDTIPPRRSREYGQAAGAAGDDVELVEIPGADHRDPIDPRGACWAAVVRWL
jgi:pimeloyl-ACP methyl ester carboxylesterase